MFSLDGIWDCFIEFSVLVDENEEDVVNDWQEMKMKIDIAFDLGMPFSDESKDVQYYLKQKCVNFYYIE
ncbi:hypothetical protein Tco_1188688 [Tanacetum coccineum]